VARQTCPGGAGPGRAGRVVAVDAYGRLGEVRAMLDDENKQALRAILMSDSRPWPAVLDSGARHVAELRFAVSDGASSGRPFAYNSRP
jgi:hypothetical protein